MVQVRWQASLQSQRYWYPARSGPRSIRTERVAFDTERPMRVQCRFCDIAMAGFAFSDTGAACDGVALSSLVATEGSPLYVYSAAVIEERYRAFDTALGSYPHRVHYALKANSTLGLVRLIGGIGSAVDANSGGEIAVAIRAGIEPNDIVFTGAGKTGVELEQAVSLGVHVINAESAGELARIDEIATAIGKRARVALRVNPDIDAKSHPAISTGGRVHKFGVPLEEAGAVYRDATSRNGLNLVGVHAHIGSQIMTLDPLRRMAVAVTTFAQTLVADGIPLKHLDLGGGLGISYDGRPSLSVDQYARTLVDAVTPTGLTLLLEPGRWIVAPSGALLATVVDVKRQLSGRYFVVLDAGMTELMRPALYNAIHRVEQVIRRHGADVTCDIVGPICETTDVIRLGHAMPLPDVGDVLIVRDTGAYGSAMASNYNRHPLPAEVLIESGQSRLIRRRQSIADLLACEE